MKRRTAAAVVLALGLGLLIVTAERLPPGRPALYDGVVVEEPYRFLHPTGGQAGSPTSVSDTQQLDNGASPPLYSGTTEQPPQAQVIADRDALVIPPGTTEIHTSIQPVEAQVPLTGGMLAGNVYRIAITNQAGSALRLAPGKTLTIVLRAPNGITAGTIVHLEGGAWKALTTENGGLPDLFAANASEVGDFAVVTNALPSGVLPSGVPGSPTPGSSTSGGVAGGFAGLTPWIIIGLAAVAAAVSLLWTLRRGSSEP